MEGTNFVHQKMWKKVKNKTLSGYKIDRILKKEIGSTAYETGAEVWSSNNEERTGIEFLKDAIRIK